MFVTDSGDGEKAVPFLKLIYMETMRNYLIPADIVQFLPLMFTSILQHHRSSVSRIGGYR